MSQSTVLIVEDDPALREALSDTLELAGYPVVAADEGGAALEILEQEPVGMVVSDVQMRPMDGYRLLKRIKNSYPELPVLLMTAYGTIEKAVDAMRDGAVDYLVKPFEAELLLNKVASTIIDTSASAGSGPVAEDLRSIEVLALARRVAVSDVTVMVQGESGTGKEVFARYIHNSSQRRDGPFVAINCAAIPESMLEAVLFGYEKGAFTGAYQSTAGKFEQAQGGTLLLDEISEMSLALQAKLLRVLQERELERLGGRRIIELDVRVLATTNRNLREEVAAGRFREDLFYRLNVFPLLLPPLRERQHDILPLAKHLIRQHLQPGEAMPIIEPAAEQLLLSHRWPGNVRELDNLIQRALIMRQGENIRAEDLSFGAGLSPEPDSAEAKVSKEGGRRLPEDLRSVEEQMIMEALREGKGSRTFAAERLGISQRTLRYKIARMREAGVEIPG
ncbi:sigma-54-dependent transcriptional regulator [endosymbiont of Ridgeia piscesae]|jgi:two-component system response regulator FlrC|uniref:DNA-binding transcriptional response regulator, NtrC family n=1 Tax=endosymbiont of Ridgeia piscesae TaxID=54398 RepID=A0A0T5YY79_9GAMM|nr:sigma-54 dependent transcriptional regulator [endosymbiont of Ridgeia piscesae]KRT55473.1 DNA-binding transcriptional response regulator, NtrC family [endosymbiont of Ridgeia piscesae]KRT58043.1 two-component system, response regulator FlrC [endosymbiont of Ridgeia piscesae]